MVIVLISHEVFAGSNPAHSTYLRDTEEKRKHNNVGQTGNMVIVLTSTEVFAGSNPALSTYE